MAGQQSKTTRHSRKSNKKEVELGATRLSHEPGTLDPPSSRMETHAIYKTNGKTKKKMEGSIQGTARRSLDANGKKKIKSSILILACLLPIVVATEELKKDANLRILKLNWNEVEKPAICSLWVLVTVIALIVYDKAKWIAHFIPDSTFLALIGVVLGLLIKVSEINISLILDPSVFFVYLLPMIILDAGYFMPNRSLINNADSIATLAVIGTVFNTLLIGSSLLFLANYGLFTLSFTPFELLVFAALISCTDPVAVIAVFEECNVNEFLFVHVFGEALFNDGIALVLYNLFTSFAVTTSGEVSIAEYGFIIVAFLVVAVSSVLLGLVFAFITSFASKYTYESMLISSSIVLIVSYIGYLVAHMTSLSTIISMAICGMALQNYYRQNVTIETEQCVRKFIKTSSQLSEKVVYLFLGLTLVGYSHHWDTWFVIATIALCTIWRSIGILLFSSILNKLSNKNLNKIDQFILSYGGLRGAIGYGLAMSISDSITAKPMFVTATMSIIFFNVVLQGITIKPLVKYFKLGTTSPEREDVEEPKCQEDSYLYKFLTRVDKKILRPILVREHKEAPEDVQLSGVISAELGKNGTKDIEFGNLLHQKYIEGQFDSSTYGLLMEALNTPRNG